MEVSGPMDLLSNEEIDRYLTTADNWTEDDLNTLSAVLPSTWGTTLPDEWYSENFNMAASLNDASLLPSFNDATLPPSLNGPAPQLPLDDSMDGIINWVGGPMLDDDFPALIGSAQGFSDDREHGTIGSYSVSTPVPPNLPAETPLTREILDEAELEVTVENADTGVSPETAQGGRQDEASLENGGTRTRRRIKPSEWDEKRDLIIALYIDQEKTLPATRDIMAKDHGFYASEKAYKDKIREWQLVKNLKKHQIIYMLKVARKRRAEEGKDTTFFYRGNRVPEEKLRRYSRTMSTSSTIRSVPSRVSFLTPRNSAQISSRGNQVLSKSPRHSRYEQVRPKSPVIANVHLRPQGKATPGIDVGKTEAFLHLKSRLLDLFFYPTGWIDYPGYQSSYPTISSQKRMPRDIITTVAATADKVRAALWDFTRQIEAAGIKPALLTEFILSPSFEDEFQAVQNRIGLQSRRLFALPLSIWQAQCLIAARRFPEGEIFLDAILSEYEHTTSAGEAEHLENIFPVLVLMGKAYLAQQKYYMLERTLQFVLQNMDGLGDESDKKKFHRNLSLRKMLYIGRTYQIKAINGMVPPFDRSYTVEDKAYESDTTLANDLTSSEANAEIDNSLWALSMYDTLRYHYNLDFTRSTVPLRDVLRKMQSVAQSMLTEALGKSPSGDGERFEADCRAVRSISYRMLESYRNTGMDEEAAQWEEFLQNARAMPRADSERLAPGSSLAVSPYFDYAIQVMGPLFQRFLGEWPPIGLPVASDTVAIDLVDGNCQDPYRTRQTAHASRFDRSQVPSSHIELSFL